MLIAILISSRGFIEWLLRITNCQTLLSVVKPLKKLEPTPEFQKTVVEMNERLQSLTKMVSKHNIDITNYSENQVEKSSIDQIEKKLESFQELYDSNQRLIYLGQKVNDISEKLVEEVVQIVSEYKGKHSLVFNVADHLNKYEVDLLSRKMKVDLSKEFFSQIGELDQLKLKVK